MNAQTSTEYEAKKAKALELARDSLDRWRRMPRYSVKGVAKHYKISHQKAAAIKRGEDPAGIGPKIIRAARLDFLRYEDLASGYKPAHEIAKIVGVSRTTVNKWTAEAGISERYATGRKPRAAPPVREATPVDRFLSMRLSRDPVAVSGYY